VVEGEAVRRTTRPVGEVGRGIVGGRIAAAYGPDVS
jgi:UDP-3-O-[3-hydroxymyristoyl] N-acetylglucosamine deacetylase